MNLYDISIQSLSGEALDLKDFKGKKLLIVNVASECGFTAQYVPLQELHEKYGDKVTVIGVPCNQFGGQEPGSAEEIQSFCSKNFGVDFLLTEKVDVKGANQHELYQWLTQKAHNGVEDTSVKWNFNKYLIGEDGSYLGYFESGVDPLEEQILEKIK